MQEGSDQKAEEPKPVVSVRDVVKNFQSEVQLTTEAMIKKEQVADDISNF